MRGKCERRRGSANVAAAGANVIRRAMSFRGSTFSAHGCNFTAVARRTYNNNTRTREPLRRKCVKPADLTTHSLPEHFRSPAPRRCIPRRPHNPFPAEDLRPPPHNDTPCPSTSAPPHSADARPQAARCIPRRPHNSFPAAPRYLPFRSALGTKKTAPHSACAMPNVSVDRRCGRSFGLVSRALFAAVAGRWRVGVGLRPQPWALRSRRCGRVLRA